MRIWDIPVQDLCKKHLSGEHLELHALYSIISLNKKGYRNHPETKRWEGKLAALYKRHEEQVVEMQKRGWKHNSPLDKKYATGKSFQDEYVHTVSEQIEILRGKNCDCQVSP